MQDAGISVLEHDSEYTLHCKLNEHLLGIHITIYGL